MIATNQYIIPVIMTGNMSIHNCLFATHHCIKMTLHHESIQRVFLTIYNYLQSNLFSINIGRFEIT